MNGRSLICATIVSTLALAWPSCVNAQPTATSTPGTRDDTRSANGAIGEHTRMLAIVGATIIDGNGGPPIDDGVILIKDERIAAIGTRSIPVSPDAKKVSAAGKFVIPGLMDANVHLFYAITPGALARFDGYYEDVIAEAAQIALRSGLTTVFDTWGPREALSHVRDRISEGDIVGSRVFLAGNIIGLGGPTSSDFFSQSRGVLSKGAADTIDARWERGVGPDLLWMTPEEVRARVRRYIEDDHPDFVKYAGSGHAQMQLISFSERVQRVIVEEGHRAGLTVQAHTTSPESLRMEIEAGADLLQHCDITGMERMPDETVAAIAQRRIPCAAFFVTQRFLAWIDAHEPELSKLYRTKDENDHRLVAANAPLLLATDEGVWPADAAENPLLKGFVLPDDSHYVMGAAHLHWLKAAEELGMPPMAALMAGTRNIARAYHVDRNLGTLEKGKIADLLILDKDPLQNADNYAAISLIIKDGQIVDRGSLPTHPKLTAPLDAHTGGH